MPTLKQITCQIEYGPRNIVLAEYATKYGDGFVDTYICVPEHSEHFCIHLSSSGYIAPGLAMFVFIDGVPQCNRNRRDLVIPDATTKPEQTEVDFRVKQKEDKIGRGCWLGREWTFAHLNTASNKSINSDDGSSHNIGTIEIVVLRCQDIAAPVASTEATDAKKPKESSDVKIESSKTKSTAGQSDSVVELLGSLFDGPSDELYESHDIGRGFHSPFVYQPGGYNGISNFRGQRRDSPSYHRMAHRDTYPEPRSATNIYDPLRQWSDGQKTSKRGETWEYNRDRHGYNPRLDEYQTKDQDNLYRAQLAQGGAEDTAYKRPAHAQRRVQVMSPSPPLAPSIPRWLRQPSSNISSNWAKEFTERANVRPPQWYDDKPTPDLSTYPAGSLAGGFRFGPTRRYRRDHGSDLPYTHLGERSTWNPGYLSTNWPLKQAQRRKFQATPERVDSGKHKKDDHADIDTKSHLANAAGSDKYGDYKHKGKADRTAPNRWESHKDIWEDEDVWTSIRGNRNDRLSDFKKWKKDEWKKSIENEITKELGNFTRGDKKKNNKNDTVWYNDGRSSSSSNGDSNDTLAWNTTTSKDIWGNPIDSSNAWVKPYGKNSQENKIDTNNDNKWGNADNDDNIWGNADNNDNGWNTATNDNTLGTVNNHDECDPKIDHNGWGSVKATSPTSSTEGKQKEKTNWSKKKHRERKHKAKRKGFLKREDIATAVAAAVDAAFATPADDGETSLFDPTKPPMKPYWSHAAHCERSDKDNREAEGRSKVYVTPEEPLRAIPKSVAEAKKLSHQVQPGKGVVYKHSIARPKYIDSMRHPYAVFTFKYRSKEVLEKLLSIEVKESKEPMRSRLEAMSKDKIIEQFMRAKKRAGYDEDSSLDATTPATSSSSSSSQVSSSSDSHSSTRHEGARSTKLCKRNLKSSAKHKGEWSTKSGKKDTKEKKSKKNRKEEKGGNNDNHTSNPQNSNNNVKDSNTMAAENW